MNAQISPISFNFESSFAIRAIIINGAPWFIAMDVCKVLQLANPSMSLKVLDNDERSKFNLGRQGNANIISESGLYTLILRCRDAVTPGTTPHRFRKWVTSEVLPQIRKTGSYTMPGAGEKIAERIAEKCAQKIMSKTRGSQYHYSDCEVGPPDVIPTLLSKNRDSLQTYALLRELASNGYDVAGVHRELEVMRYFLIEQQLLIADMVTKANNMVKKSQDVLSLMPKK